MEKRIDSLIPVGSARLSGRRRLTIDTVIRAGYELRAIRREQRGDLSDVLGDAFYADALIRFLPDPRQAVP
jgi:hypothetical protein